MVSLVRLLKHHRELEIDLAVYTIKVYMVVMADKRKPTYDLEAFKATFNRVEKLAVTGTALRTAAALGFGRIEIVNTIQSMQRDYFYKSMTAYADSRLWQDVSCPITGGHPVREVYSRYHNRVFTAVIQGERQ